MKMMIHEKHSCVLNYLSVFFFSVKFNKVRG